MLSGTSLAVLGLLLALDRPPEAGTLPAPPEPLRAGFEAIAEADLRAWVEFLASDELEGRETGRRGYDVAARFCATMFARYGLKPLGEAGGYFQKLEVIRSEPDPAASYLEVRDAAGVERFPLAGNVALSTSGDLEWGGEWVFAGHGEGADQDAPDDFSGLQVSEKVVMVLARPGQTRFHSRGAAAAGARRIVVIYDERVKSRDGLEANERPAFEKPRGPRTGRPEVAYLSRKAADRILKSRGLTVEGILAASGRPPRFALSGVEVKLAVKYRETTLSASNVVGIIEGSDPVLRGEAVAIGAHLDHVGVHVGKIYRGADDDASGSSGVLALAKAFSESGRRPARSVLFFLFAGEEKGLWGSRYYVDHPTFPLERIVAQLQMDMIGRNEEAPRTKERAEDNQNSLHLVGSKRHSHDLHRAVLSANRWVGLDFEYDEEDVYGRSDQLNFGERDIPVAFFFTGFHPDYHQPTDTPDKINYPKMARVLRLVFATACDLTERKDPLRRLRRV